MPETEPIGFGTRELQALPILSYQGARFWFVAVSEAPRMISLIQMVGLAFEIWSREALVSDKPGFNVTV